MSKKVSESQKKDILNAFKSGMQVKDISLKFNFTIPTIVRQLRNILGKEEFERIKNEIKKMPYNCRNDLNRDLLGSQNEDNDPLIHNSDEQFFEIAPLDEDINLEKQKEVSSESISKVDLPDMVYMIVSSGIELKTRPLKDYPDWQFLPSEDLERETIEIFSELKLAKRSCQKDQKLIKVPNTSVFKTVAHILRSKGISRIISDNKLIAL